MWARLFNKCTKCNTTKRKHYGKGLCYACYKRQQYLVNPERYKAWERERYKKNSNWIKARARDYYHHNHKKCLKACKKYREAKHFNGLREQIMKRDKYRCRCCHNKGTVVHHIDGQGRGTKNPNNDPKNLITLCRACHLDIHNADRISRKHNLVIIKRDEDIV